MNKTIVIGKKNFSLQNRRAYKPVYVYKGRDLFLRLGPAAIVQKELKLHQRLIKLGFPFAPIVSSGKQGNRFYYIEESLGNIHFGQIFSKDIQNQKRISKQNFDAFLTITKKFAEAQLRTVLRIGFRKNFAVGTNFVNIIKELPTMKLQFTKAYKILSKRLEGLPFVLTHGDFSPFNIYRRGIIDLESFFWAPAGYDLVSNLCHNEFFPKNKGYEMQRVYEFTKDQKNLYLDLVDRIYLKHKLPKPSNYYLDFYVCRCIWSAARMGKWPKIQQWRYEQSKKVIRNYLRLNSKIRL